MNYNMNPEAYYKQAQQLNPNHSFTQSPNGRFLIRPRVEPYQMPQFSASNGIGMQVPGGIGPGSSMAGNPYDQTQPPRGQRPQEQPFAPGQQPYNGPAIGQYANYQPGQGIGPGGPTRNVPSFRPGGPQQAPYKLPGIHQNWQNQNPGNIWGR